MAVAAYAIVRPESLGNVRLFETRQEALAALCRLLGSYGPEVVVGWHLARVPKRGEWVKVAEGEKMIRLAEAEAARSAA